MKTIYTIDSIECTREEFLDALAELHPDFIESFAKWEEDDSSNEFEKSILLAVKKGA
jgi:hypothetical protein